MAVLYPQMELNRRRVPRIVFAGVAELSVAEPPKHVIAAATNLGLFGCFIKTMASFPVGCKVNVRVTYEGDEITAGAEVVYVLPEKGIGIAFGAISPNGQTILEHWLSEPEQGAFHEHLHPGSGPDAE